MGKYLLAAVLALSVTPLAAAPISIVVSVPGPGAASYLPVELIPKIGADKQEGVEVTVRFTSAAPPRWTSSLARTWISWSWGCPPPSPRD